MQLICVGQKLKTFLAHMRVIGFEAQEWAHDARASHKIALSPVESWADITILRTSACSFLKRILDFGC